MAVTTPLGQGLRIFWALSVPDPANPETKSFGAVEMPYSPMMAYATRNAKFAGDVTGEAMMWEIVDPSLDTGLSLARSFRPTSSPHWLSWWLWNC